MFCVTDKMATGYVMLAYNTPKKERMSNGKPNKKRKKTINNPFFSLSRINPIQSHVPVNICNKW